MMGGIHFPPTLKGLKMDKYFKKSNGVVIKYDPLNHDLESLKDRFQECDADGKDKPKPKPKPKAKKKEE